MSYFVFVLILFLFYIFLGYKSRSNLVKIIMSTRTLRNRWSM